MALADSPKQFLLHLESYLVYGKEDEVVHCHQSCLLLVVFCCQHIKASLQKCKTFDFSVFAGISLAVAFKRRKLDFGKNRITSSSILCTMEDLYIVNKLIRLPHFMIH